MPEGQTCSSIEFINRGEFTSSPCKQVLLIYFFAGLSLSIIIVIERGIFFVGLHLMSVIKKLQCCIMWIIIAVSVTGALDKEEGRMNIFELT